MVSSLIFSLITKIGHEDGTSETGSLACELGVVRGSCPGHDTGSLLLGQLRC